MKKIIMSFVFAAFCLSASSATFKWWATFTDTDNNTTELGSGWCSFTDPFDMITFSYDTDSAVLSVIESVTDADEIKHYFEISNQESTRRFIGSEMNGTVYSQRSWFYGDGSRFAVTMVASVPEPSNVVLILIGVCGLLLLRKDEIASERVS